MALVSLDGGFNVLIGPPPVVNITGGTGTTTTVIDAANEAWHAVGPIIWADGGSHTINTTGSSAIRWRSATVTFANAGTTCKVGVAAVSAVAGPPGRAANAADVITFDVSKTMVGGGGGVTGSTFHNHVPDAGTKTIATGDVVAVGIQLTARAGADSIQVTGTSTDGGHYPFMTSFLGGAYALITGAPDIILVASDGTVGWFAGSYVFNTLTTRTWNSGSATKEYGQLYKLPFPAKIYGLYAWVDPDADYDLVLYSDPLGGSPVAERTISVDATTMSAAAVKRSFHIFSTPYSAKADQLIGAVVKPGAVNISMPYRTLSSATHRVADVCGTDGYGISRASGAFADANSGLDHYLIGLMCGGFEHSARASYHLGI